jgi:hypothetical protein
MNSFRQFLVSCAVGSCIAGVGFAFSVSNSFVLNPLGLAMNWHLVLLASLTMPGMNPELTPAGVLAWALFLPAVEWTLITRAVMSIRSRRRET